MHDKNKLKFWKMKKLIVKSDLSELNKIRFFIRKNIRLTEILEKEFYIVELSILEICINIIKVKKY